MNTTLPNSFQTPNFIVDQVLHLIKPEEYVVLSFAIRHILGWKDRIGGRQHTISLSCFEEGYTDRDGNVVYGGCGLTRPKIKQALEALVTYGLLKKIGEPGQDGQCWELPFDTPDIDWEGLRARKAAAVTKNRQRVAKAAKASANHRRKEPPSTTAVPPDSTVDVLPPSTVAVPPDQYDSRTTPGTVDVPPGSTTAVQNQTQYQIQSSNPIDSAGTPDGGPQPVVHEPSQIPVSTSPTPRRKSSAPSKTTIPAELMNPMKDAIVSAFGWGWDTMTDAEKGQVQKAAQQLCKAKATPGQIDGLYAFCKRRFDHFSPMALTSSWSAYQSGGSNGSNTQRSSAAGNRTAEQITRQRPQVGELPPPRTTPAPGRREL